MVEGFWIVQYEGVRGNGGGVAVLMRGHLLGGDTGFVYTGKYRTDNKNISAHISVRNFLPEIQSVLGVSGDFELQFSATVSDNIIQGTASLVGQEGAGVAIRLTRVSDLPA